MRKIVSFNTLSSDHIDLIRNIAPGWEFVQGENELLRQHLKDAEIVLGWNSIATEECFKPDAKLRWVQNWGAGVDKIPLDKLLSNHILLTNASGVHAYPISETIFAMMLSLARKVHLSIRN